MRKTRVEHDLGKPAIGPSSPEETGKWRRKSWTLLSTWRRQDSLTKPIVWS